MPTTSVSAEGFLEAHGIQIYHVYKGDDIDQGVRTFWYSLDPDSRDEGHHEDYQGFDVRDLAAYQELTEGGISSDLDVIRQALELALVRGELEELIIAAKRDGVIEEEA